MIWEGRELVTVSDFLGVVEKIADANDRVKAQEFMRLALEETPHARSNIGYMSGYLSRETAHRIYDLFDVEHPILGREDLGPVQIMASGVVCGKAVRDGVPMREAMGMAREVAHGSEEAAKEILRKFREEDQ